MLARWSGWGAVPQLFDLDAYATERAELQRLLTRDEYVAARRSTVNAHYTDAALVRVVWDAVQRLGFTGGVVLEPGCGSGHFIGLAPPSARLIGVEREPISAGVAAALYPRAQVITGSFADVRVAEGAVDAVVGNVPFAKVVLHDPRHNSGGHSIHNHFLIKALHLTRPGGIVAILTSRYTMDAVNPAARAEMARLADLVGAVRLPTGAHRRTAGTDAVTDLLILRRREPGAPARVSFEDTWEKSLPTEVGDGGETVEINRYFLDHLDNVLGTFSLDQGMYGRESLTVVGDPAATAVQLAAAVERITADARDRGLTMSLGLAAAMSPRPAVAVNVIDPDAATFRGFLTAHPDGSFTERGRDHDLPYVPSAADADELRMLIGLRDVTMALVWAEQASVDDTPQMDVLRGRLNRDYDAYVARFGPIRRFTQRRQLRQVWHVFSEWCDRHERDRLPTNADTVRDCLSDLAHRGVGQDQLRRHLDGIAKAHVTAQTRQVRKAAASLLDGLVADGAERDTATEMVTRLAQNRPDELLRRAGVTPVRFSGEALAAGQEVVAAAPAATSPGLDLDELGLRTTVIRRPPQGGFRTSPFAAVVRALEKFDPTTQTARKALIFTQRVINPPPTRLGASTPEEALSICLDIHSRVDLPEIARLLGLPDAQHARAALGELVYDDPDSGEPIWARTYLAGNVRQKLAQARLAAEAAPALAVNVAALERVVPADLGPEDIEIRLGSWIGAAYVRLFLREVLDDDTVVVEQVGGLWGVAGNKDTVAATQLWGGGGLDVFALTEKLLVGSEIKVMRIIEVPGPKGDLVVRQVLDPEATEEAKDKAVEIGDRFADWVWEDTARAQDLIDTYNALFNSEIPPDFSGVELSLPGLSAAYSLREHQRTAIARIIYQPGTGLVHDVGAGKTLEMIVGVMERRRRGLSVTPVVVVPNDSIADQFEREWMLAYPSARLLAATSADLGETTDGAGRRAEVVARIATDDWDAVIMTKEAFQRIPLHAQAQEKFLAAELDDLREAREAARGELSQTMTKRVETAIEQAEERLKRRLDEIDRDGAGVTFRDSGIDLVVVDEAQTYKNGMLISSLPGLAIEGADRSLDLDMKLAWLAEQHGGPRCVLATATPFTNSFGEVYLWQRRLGHQMPAFDVWARTYCTSEAFMEMTPGGTLRARSRMRRVINEPELWRALRLTTDIKMQEDLNLPVPARRGGAVEILTVPAAPEARIFTLDLARRERNLTGKPEKGADNPLVIQHDGTLVALDVRTVGLRTDHPQKVDHVADDIHAEWSAARDTVYLRDDGTEHPIRGGMILVFCDESTPGKNWNFYGELKRQLVLRGMDENSIRFIHEAGSSVQRKADLLAAGREGAISVLVGSTMKMGAGINVQDRLIGGYELTGPWRADTSAQAEGRIRRRGNQNPEYFWKRVVTAPSMDARKWETTGQKHNMFAPMLSSTPPSRTREITDDQSVGLADVMAAATGDARYREKAELDQEHKALTRRRSAHARTQQSLKLAITSLTARIPQREALAIRQDAVATRHVSTRGDAFRMEIGGRTYSARTEAADALREFLRSWMAATPRSHDGQDVPVGSLGGYRVSAALRPLREFSIRLVFPDAAENSEGLVFDHRSLPDRHGLITRLENELDGILDAADRTRAETAADRRSLEQARSGVGKPFPHAERLEVVGRRRAELIAELSGDLDNDHTELAPDSPEAKARAERIEARRRDHAVMTTAAQQHAARCGTSAAYAGRFAGWYVAIAADVTTDQRPDLATAYTVWNDLNHPTATTRGSSKPGPAKASDTEAVARIADVAPEPPAPITAPAPSTTGATADDQADDGVDQRQVGAKPEHRRAAAGEVGRVGHLREVTGAADDPHIATPSAVTAVPLTGGDPRRRPLAEAARVTAPGDEATRDSALASRADQLDELARTAAACAAADRYYVIPAPVVSTVLNDGQIERALQGFARAAWLGITAREALRDSGLLVRSDRLTWHGLNLSFSRTEDDGVEVLVSTRDSRGWDLIALDQAWAQDTDGGAHIRAAIETAVATAGERADAARHEVLTHLPDPVHDTERPVATADTAGDAAVVVGDERGPAAGPVGAGPGRRTLTLHYSFERGVMLLGTDRSDGIADLLRPARAGWKWRQVETPTGERGAWLLPKTLRVSRPRKAMDAFHGRLHDRLSAAGEALIAAGYAIRFDLHNLPTYTAQGLNIWATRAHLQAGIAQPDTDQKQPAPVAVSLDATADATDAPVEIDTPEPVADRPSNDQPYAAQAGDEPETAAAVTRAAGVAGQPAATVSAIRALAEEHGLAVRVVRVGGTPYITVHEPAVPTPAVLCCPTGAADLVDGAGETVPWDAVGSWLRSYRTEVRPELFTVETTVRDWARRVAHLVPHVLTGPGHIRLVEEPLQAAIRLVGQPGRDDEVEQWLRRAEGAAPPLTPTPERHAQLVRAVQDQAATWHRITGDAARYILELVDGSGREWDWLTRYLTEHPEVLQQPAPTPTEITDRDQAERAESERRSQEASTLAAAAYRAGDADRALALLDEAELADPSRAQRWHEARNLVREAQSRAPTPTVPPPSTSAVTLDDLLVPAAGVGKRTAHRSVTATEPPSSPGGTRQAEVALHARITTAAAQWFEHQLDADAPAAADARQYLADRLGGPHQLDHVRRRGFCLGYAPTGWTTLTDHLRAQGFRDDDLIAAGVATVTSRNTTADRFRNRIMFGIRDADGRMAGFIGRALSDTDNAKYLNSPTSSLFDKSTLLFGWSEQQDLAGRADPVFVEGPLDVLALLGAADAQHRLLPVAACGTALTTGHLDAVDVLVSLDRRRVFAFDGDAEGRKAALTRAVAAVRRYPDLHITTLPDDLDPAGWALAVGVDEQLAAYLGGPHTRPALQVLVDARVAVWQERLQWAEGRLGAARDVARLLATLDPGRVVDLAVTVATRLQLDPAVMAEFVATARHDLREPVPPLPDRRPSHPDEAAPDTPAAGPEVTSGPAADDAHPASAPPADTGTAAPDSEDAVALASVVVTNDRTATVPDPRTQPSSIDVVATGGSEASPAPPGPGMEAADAADQAGRVEPGPWSRRIDIALVGDSAIVSGTSRDDPAVLRTALKDHFGWRPKEGAVWKYLPRRHGVDRDTAVATIRRVLVELDAQAAAQAQPAPSHPPTPQQQAIIDACLAGRDVAVRALAGTGKTSTLRMVAARMPDKKITYIAFNRSIADAAQAAFGPSVVADTMHAFARQALRAHPIYRTKLATIAGNDGYPSEVAAALGLDADRSVTYGRHGQIDATGLVRLALGVVKRFRESADPRIGPEHLAADAVQSPEGLTDLVLDVAGRIWADKTSRDGRLRFTHDDYLKVWALADPRIPGDVIFFDEVQDVSAVQAAVVQSQPVQIVVVGDSFQSIYGFRGARDFLRTWPADVTLSLTKSWRFGPAVADLGNRFLGLLHGTLQLEGNPVLDSQLGQVADPDAVLCRTNAAVVAAVFSGLEAGKRVALVGGGGAIKDIARAAQDLQRGRHTRHPDLSMFANWDDARDYVEQHDDAQSLRTFVRLVDKHRPEGLIALADRLTDEAEADPRLAAELVVSTSHKAKGREWTTVRIADDYPRPTEDADTGQLLLPSAEDLRLAYVTVTRAQHRLDLGSLDWILDPTYRPTRTIAVAQPAAEVAPRDVPTADPVVADAAGSLAPPAAVASVSAQHPARGNTSGAAHPAAQDTADDPDLELHPADLEAAELTDRDLAVTVLGLTGNQFAAMVRGLDDDEPGLASGYWSRRRPLDLPDAGALESVKHNAKGFVIEVRTATTVRAGRASWERVNDWLRAGMTPGARRVLFAADTALTRFQLAEPGFLAAGHLELCDMAQRELDGHLDQARRAIVDRALAAQPGTITRSRRRRPGTAPDGADPLTPVDGLETIGDQIDLPATDQAALDRIDALSTMLPIGPGRETPVSQIQVGAVVQHPDHPDRALRITAPPVTRADGVELVGVLLGVPGGHDSPARWSVANSDHADPTIDLVPLPVLERPLVADTVPPIASADQSPAADNDLDGRLQVPDDLDLTAAGWTRAEISYHQQGPVERWTRDDTELTLRWTSTDDDLELTNRVLVNGTEHVIESVADLRTIVNEAGRVGTARFDGQSTVTAGLTAAAAALPADAESDQPATDTGPTANASRKESTAWRPGDLFERAVAEGRRAIVETAAAGGHKPAAWLAFSRLVRTDPTSGTAYSAVEPESVEVARWWIDQATAGLAEVGYRVEYHPPQGRRSRRARQVEVDHDARLVVLDAGQPPTLAVGFTLVAEVARLRGAAGDVGGGGQVETQAVSVDPDLEPTVELRAAGDTADLDSGSSAADTQQPELLAQATLFDLTPTPPSRNDAGVRAVTGTPTKAANRVDEHPPVPSTNPPAGTADRGSTTNDAPFPQTALTDVDIALALRHQFGERLAELVQAMGTPGAPLTSIVHAGRVGNRNADEPDAGAHERIDATTRNLTIDVRTATEHRTGTLTWSKVAAWLRAGLDPVDVRVLLDAYRAHYRFYVNSTGFEVIGERDLAADAGDELKAMAGAAAERILDRAVRTHAAGDAPRRWSGRGPDPLAQPALDGELPAAQAAQLARVAALSTVLPDRIESSVDLADVQVGDVLVDWRNTGGPFRVRTITDRGDTVDLIGEVITSWRGTVADTMTVHKNSQFGTPMTMLLMAIPASLASLRPLHTEQTTVGGAGRAEPAMPAVPPSLTAVVDPPRVQDAAVVDGAVGSHHDPGKPKGQLAIEAISLVPAATVGAPTLREQFAALPMPTPVRVHEPARIAFNQARRALHEPDVTPTQRARVIINLGSERPGEAADVAEQLDALAAMVDASGHHQLVDATLPFALYLRHTSNEIRRQVTSGSDVAAPAVADLLPSSHAVPTPAAAVEAADRTTFTGSHTGPAGAPGEIELSPELVTPAVTHLLDVDTSPSMPEKLAPVEAGSVEPEPVEVSAGTDDQPDDPAAADDPALHWSGLVARAAGHGFGVHTTYTGESRIDDAAATIHIAAGQPPLSRIVDLALKVGELAVRHAGIESVPAEQFEPQLPTRPADDPASLRWPAGPEMSEPVSPTPGPDPHNGHDQSGASARNGWSAYPWEVPEPRAEMDTPIFDQLRADPPLAMTSLSDPPWYPAEPVQDHTPIFERLWREMGLLADPTAAPVIALREDGVVGPPNAHPAGRAGLPGSPSPRPGPRTAAVAEAVGSGRARGRQ